MKNLPRRPAHRRRPVFLLGGLLALPMLAAAQAATYREPPAQSIRVAPAARTAAAPVDTTPLAAVAAALRDGGASAATVGALVETDAESAPKIAAGAPVRRHVRYQQRIDGVPVHGSDVKAAFDPNGALQQVVARVAPLDAQARRAARVDERQALAAALGRLHPGLDAAALVERPRSGATLRFGCDGKTFHADPEVTRVWIPQEDGGLQQGYRVQTWTARDNQLDETLVGGDGTVLEVASRTARDSYNVFKIDPDTGPQAVVKGPGTGNAQSPGGWLGTGTQKTVDITGNNVRAYLDVVSDNVPDGGGTTVTNGAFVASADLSQKPGTATNQAVAVQNLFFLNNTLHDVLYRHGFDEAAGNFQVDNFGKGGKGGDAVLAEAQDGGGVNNANFATPSDGSSPRMQMYLWSTSGASQRDGDLDSDIVYHEYGHGLTWRMVGNMSGPLAGAIGEGASDVLALLLNGDCDVIAAYAYGDPEGIRRYRYTGYPLTYADVKGQSVHADGEIYAAAMWRLRELWVGSGRDVDALLGLYVDGLDHIAPTPTHETMRNGLLDAVVHTGGNDTAARCAMVWQAFGQLGIGDGAKGVVSGSTVTVTPSTKTRKDCSY